MGPEEIHHIVVLTGRLSAGLFVLALIGGGLGYRAIRLWLVFLVGQAVHFSFVAWFADATGGINLFPGGRSLQDVGGWPTIFGIFAFFYLLASAKLIAARRDAGRPLRLADKIGTSLIGLFFLATYVPLLAESALFIAPIAAILGALAFFLAHAARARSGGSP